MSDNHIKIQAKQYLKYKICLNTFTVLLRRQ